MQGPAVLDPRSPPLRHRRQLATGKARMPGPAARARRTAPPPRHASLIAAPVRGLPGGRRGEDARLPSTTSLASASSAALPARHCGARTPAGKARQHTSAGNAPCACHKHPNMGNITHGPRKVAIVPPSARPTHMRRALKRHCLAYSIGPAPCHRNLGSDTLQRTTIPACCTRLLSPADRGASSPDTASLARSPGGQATLQKLGRHQRKGVGACT